MANENKYISQYTGRQIDHAFEVVQNISSSDEGKVVSVDENGQLRASILDVNNIMPQRVSILPSLSTATPNSRAVLGVQDNSASTASSITIAELSERIIRTADTVPSDLQTGQYVFLEKTNTNLGGN